MVRTLDDDVVLEAARTADLHGIACIPDFASAEEIEQARAFCTAQRAGSGEDYAGFVGQAGIEDTFLAALGRDPSFLSVLARLFRYKTGRTPPEDPIYQVLRTFGPDAAAKHSLKFHYDSFIVTALVPIEMPRAGGDLLILTSPRPMRRRYSRNLLDKLMVDNSLTQAALKAAYAARAPMVRRVPLTPGHLYLFWGYCTLHTNEACPPGAGGRSTALFHFADPHVDSTLKRALRGGGLRARRPAVAAPPVPALARAPFQPPGTGGPEGGSGRRLDGSPNW